MWVHSILGRTRSGVNAFLGEDDERDAGGDQADDGRAGEEAGSMKHASGGGSGSPVRLPVLSMKLTLLGTVVPGLTALVAVAPALAQQTNPDRNAYCSELSSVASI
jgi:hypothetical protein